MTDSYPRPLSDIASMGQHMRMFRGTGAAEAVFDPSYTLSGTSLRVSANGTSNVSVAVGEGSIMGVHYYQDAIVTKAVPTNAGNASSRKDLVVLRLTFAGDATAISVVYKTGGTTEPNITRDFTTMWEVRLAAVTVLAGAATVPSGNVVNRRVLTAPAPIIGDGSYRPTAQGGQFLIEPSAVAVGLPGGTWADIWPIGNGAYQAIGTPGSGVNKFASGWRNYNEASGVSGFANAGYHRGPGDLLTMQGAAQCTTPKSANALIFTLPAGSRPTSHRVFNQRGGTIDIDDTGAVRVGTAMGDNDHIFFDGITLRVV